MCKAINLFLNGIRRREAKVSNVGGIDGLRPLPITHTAIAEIYRFRSDLQEAASYRIISESLTNKGWQSG
jgi:hypothetical protein